MKIELSMINTCEAYFYKYGLLPDHGNVSTESDDEAKIKWFISELIDEYKKDSLDNKDIETIKKLSPSLYQTLQLRAKDEKQYIIRLNNYKTWVETYAKVPSDNAGNKIYGFIARLRHKNKSGDLTEQQIKYINSIDEAILDTSKPLARSIILAKAKEIKGLAHKESGWPNSQLQQALFIYNIYNIHNIEDLHNFISELITERNKTVGISDTDKSLINIAYSDFRLDQAINKWFYSEQIASTILSKYLRYKYFGDVKVLINTLQFSIDDIVLKSEVYNKLLRDVIDATAYRLRYSNRKRLIFILRFYNNITSKEIENLFGVSRQHVQASISSVLKYTSFYINKKREQSLSGNGEVKESEANDKALVKKTLENIGLSTRTYNTLRRARIHDLEQLISLFNSRKSSEIKDMLLSISGLGQLQAEEILRVVGSLKEEDLYKITDISDTTQGKQERIDKLPQAISSEYRESYYKTIEQLAGLTDINDIKLKIAQLCEE